MLILPVATPLAAIDQNSINQAQQNQVQSSEESRKASDTVKISSEAQQLAGSVVNDKQPAPQQSPGKVTAAEAQHEVQKAAQADVPRNPVTKAPEGSKIDVVS